MPTVMDMAPPQNRPYQSFQTGGLIAAPTVLDQAWQGWVTTTNQLITTAHTTTTAGTYDDAWFNWNGGTGPPIVNATTATASSITYDGVWQSWNSGTAATDAAITIDTAGVNDARMWRNWAETSIIINPGANVRIEPETDEQKEKREQRQKCRDLKARIKTRRKTRVATALLRRLLCERQMQEWDLYRAVRVVGSDGGLFEINPRWCGHLYQLDPVTGEPLRKLCVHPCTSFPVEDRVAALALNLQSDERDVIDRANAHHFSKDEKRAVQRRRRTCRRDVAFAGPATLN